MTNATLSTKTHATFLLQVILQHAETEIRLEQEPFPLYPGEEVLAPVTALTVVAALNALRLKVHSAPCSRNFQNVKLRIDFVEV